MILLFLKCKGNVQSYTKSMHSMFRCSAPFDMLFTISISTNSTVLCTFIYNINLLK